MAPRVKAVVRPPRHGWATDREVVVVSDEEWVHSSAESSGTGSSTSKQRRSDDLDRLQTMQSDKQPAVMAPSPEMTEFVSWGALDVYLKGYSAETRQSFRVRTNNKVETRNKKIQDSGSTKPLVPEEWVHYSKTVVCTHAGRYKPRGQGKRKRQPSRALDCGVQTKHMRELFARFPEVVMIDTTHGTNLSKYKVFSIMAHDVFGNGQFVQDAVIQNERNPTLLTALEQFKRYNPAWCRIKCILIDKDFGEICALKNTFPDATLLLCQFHVLKYLREQTASKDYGFNAWQKQQLN
ncbi:uncharacterized protein IUM83_17028 [Phytophthora cinnamomi]|uniref:uncharacterized protein n=1 Tax=Phytophthora cinnamomi TaxID=4785 RepID=UPI003559C80E|nr:hypothetical protein IUM83_17028 [Phytophthora cinnamomi]